LTVAGLCAILGSSLLAAPAVGEEGGGTSPNNCFANLQGDEDAGPAEGTRVHILCTEPENNPCVAKAKVKGTWLKVCSPT
jgi:hypothetical protein